jgi:uncharacterized cupredoxin-like copper-binding protein
MKHHLKLVLMTLMAVLLVSACASSGSTWTPPPVVTPGPETAAPSPAPTGAPTHEPSAAPTSEPSAPSTAAPETGAPTAGSTGEPPARVLEIEETAALQIQLDGEQVHDIPVTVGETITFRVTNTAGFPHNFYIGPDQQLASNQVQGLPGVPEFSSGTQEFTWTVPADVTELKFGCTVPGHYTLMQGTFSIAQ